MESRSHFLTLPDALFEGLENGVFRPLVDLNFLLIVDLSPPAFGSGSSQQMT